MTQVATQQWEMLREVIDGHGIYQGRRFGSPEATRKGGWQARFRVDSDLPRRIDRD